jgi:hypothetical protein
MKKLLVLQLCTFATCGIMFIGCSSEEAINSSAQAPDAENFQEFRTAFDAYAKSRVGGNISKASSVSSAEMAESSIVFLTSIGFEKESFKITSQESEAMIINLAFTEFAKIKTSRK